MSEPIRDGRDGKECPDCGAYLQWWTNGGQHFRRCPWAHPKTWRMNQHVIDVEIYCDWPKAARVPGGVPTVLPETRR